MRRSDGLSITLGLMVMTVAVGRTLTSPAPTADPDLSVTDERAVFEAVALGEPDARDRAKERFISDRWSQDDDFHAWEHAQLQSFASSRHVSLTSVWRAFDKGLRHHLLTDARRAPRVNVPPCRPRPLN